jgi:hypothetical protein
VLAVEKVFPNEYGHSLSVDYASDNELYNINGHLSEEEEEKAIKHLRSKGFTVIEPSPDMKPKRYISISAERGGTSHVVETFIRKTFNVIDYTYDG